MDLAGRSAWLNRAGAPVVLLPGLALAALLGWLASAHQELAIALALAVLVAPLALKLELSLRAWAIVLALGGHLVSGPLYIQGIATERYSLLLDLLALAAVALLAFEPRTSPRLWRGAVLALAGLILLEAFNPLLPSINYGLTGARSILVPLLLLVAVGSGGLSRRDQQAIISVAAAGWALNVLFAGRQLIFGFTGPELNWIEASRATFLVEEQIRLIGATRSNQDFAFLVGIAFPAVCAAALARGKPIRWRIGFGLLVLGTLTVLIGSLVRTGLVAGVIGALAVAIAMASDPVTRRRLAVWGIGFAATLWVVVGIGLGLVLEQNQTHTVQNRVTSIFEPGQDYAFQQRQSTVWPHALHEVAAHPLGAGAGSAGPLSQARGDAPLGPLVPDNGYLLIGVQYGLPGLMLFLAALGSIAVELWRRARLGAVAAAAAFGAVIALCVAMLTGNFISLVSPSCVWAILVGLGLQSQPPR